METACTNDSYGRSLQEDDIFALAKRTLSFGPSLRSTDILNRLIAS